MDEQRKIATITAHAGPNGWPDQAGSAQLYSHLLSCLKKEGIAYLKASCSLDEEAALLRQASARAGLAQGLASITYYQKISDLILARPSQLNLVPAEKKHLAGACELACQAWSGIHAEYARLLGPDLHAGIFSDWQLEKCQAVEKELSGGRGYLALAAGQLAGFISYALDDKNNYGIIGNNAVHSAWRGQGLAGLLYQHVFACLKKEGVAYVKVTTGLDAGHAPARRAYAKAGFALGIARINYLQKIQA